MGVLLKARASFAKKVKRVLKKPVTEVKPKVNCLKRPSLANEKLNSVLGTKRKSEDAEECQKAKRLKMDHCQDILAKLMKHESSCLFLVPVDSNVSRNQDYFRVIKRPMDLGTIQKKLQQYKYNDAEEFEADVRLVFANAMLYHPPSHWVHKVAVKLSRFFNILWMPVKEQARKETILSSGKSTVKTTCEKDEKSECLEAVPKHSPSTALRAAKLKARFADTILRAQTKVISLHNTTNAAASQEKKERLRQQQDRERARIEAEAKAAELAFRVKSEAKLKMQRQQEREAARASLEKMERSINLDDNFHAMRELEALIGNLSEFGRTRNPLECLGLYIKEEYSLGHDYDYEKRFLQDIDLEEGEIVIEVC